MEKNYAVELVNVSKYYKLYDKPIDRLKEALNPFHKKYHREYYALNDISLKIQSGEVIGIVGANGAGKSTLLKIVAGVLTPSKGDVRVQGRINAILELGAGLKPDMTGRENIRLHLEINKIPVSIRKEKIAEIVEFADIGNFIDQPVKTYSSGMKSRLGFALSTSMEPDILIVDEALSVGDISFKLKSYSRMKNLMKNGCTVLYVSHDLQSIINLCDRAILIMNGRLFGNGKPKDIVEEYQRKLFSEKETQKPTSGKEKEIFEDRWEKRYKKGFFTRELVKKPRILKNRDVIIREILILDEAGEVVNILKKGQRYSVWIDIHFRESFSNAMFGIQFKTINGIYIYGFRDETFYDTSVNEGDEVVAEFTFDNNLLPGTYYLNVGVASTINGKIIYLTEYSEASPFKVVDYSTTTAYTEYGIVSLNAHSELKIKEKRPSS